MNTLYSTRKPFYNLKGLLFLLIFLVLFNILFTVAGSLLAGLVNHLSFREVRELLNHPDGSAVSINISRLVNAVSIVGYMLVPVLLFVVVNQSSVVYEGGLKKTPSPRFVLIAILITALAIPAMESIMELMKALPFPDGVKYYAERFESARTGSINNILDMHEWPEFFVCLFVLALLPAMLEELMFRGVVLNILKHSISRTWLAVVLQALIFALLHFSIYELPSIFLMGLMFGFIAIWTGTIWYGVIMHFLFNGTSVFLEFLNHRQFDRTGISGNYSNPHISPAMAIGGILAMLLLLHLFHRETTEVHGEE